MMMKIIMKIAILFEKDIILKTQTSEQGKNKKVLLLGKDHCILPRRYIENQHNSQRYNIVYSSYSNESITNYGR